MSQAPTELLPALTVLLETESVTLAAKRLGVGQPAMSRTLERLREALGDELLVRDGRRLVRTRRAEVLLPDARAALAAATRVLTPPAEFTPERAEGVVTIALGDDMQSILAAPLLTRLRRTAPGLDLRVRALSIDSGRDALRGVVDLGVFPDLRDQYVIPGYAELVLTRQYTRRFVTVSRERKKLSLDAFVAAEHVLVSPGGEDGGYVDDALRDIGRKRRVAVTVPSFVAALALVRESTLVATLPDDLVRMLAPTLHKQVCPVPTPELEICVAWASRFTHDARHKWLRAEVTDVVRGLARRRV
jgi:DNA-binding transcriptional LysR family regulator